MNFSQPTPELPVTDVKTAQNYYRDKLGFEVGWYNDDGKLGAVSRGERWSGTRMNQRSFTTRTGLNQVSTKENFSVRYGNFV